MSEIKLILLDFDGTLADTRQANALAYIEALSEEGIDLSESDYLAKYFGMHCAEFMSSIGVADKEQASRIRRRKIELYPHYFSSVKLNEPLWAWCRMMRNLGAKVWIVSTGHIDNITNVMRYLKLNDGIDGIISGDDITYPKPAPDAFLKAMEIEGVSPAESIIFEDSAIGIEAAKRSGAAYVCVKFD